MELRNKWMYGGAVILVGVSALILLDGLAPSVWIPMPFPIAFVAFLGLIFLPFSNFVALLFFPFVIPSLYVLVLKLSYSSKHLSQIVLSLVVAVGLLDLLYFKVGWDYGLRWQGEAHAKIEAIQNLLGFGIAVLVGGFSLAKHSRQLALSANLFLFFLLSWCAFPYFGELP